MIDWIKGLFSDDEKSGGKKDDAFLTQETVEASDTDKNHIAELRALKSQIAVDDYNKAKAASDRRRYARLIKEGRGF